MSEDLTLVIKWQQIRDFYYYVVDIKGGALILGSGKRRCGTEKLLNRNKKEQK